MTKQELLAAADRAEVYPPGWGREWSCDPEASPNLDDWLAEVAAHPEKLAFG